MLLHGAVDGRQSESGSLSIRFGREEWFKDVLEVFVGNSTARIPDVESEGGDIASVFGRQLSIKGMEVDASGSADGMGCVDSEVEDCALQL
jgi:hypothetical protein